VVHVDAGNEGTSQSVVELDQSGVRVSAETSRRLSCDAAVGMGASIADYARSTQMRRLHD